MLGPSRPPIQLGENLVEVGWDPPAPAEDEETTPVLEEADDRPELPPDQPVEDHYAALQAWNEWSRNQGRDPSDLPGPDEAEAEAEAEGPVNLLDDDETPNPAARDRIFGHVWAEAPDRFAPYGQMFSKLRQPKDRD